MTENGLVVGGQLVHWIAATTCTNGLVGVWMGLMGGKERDLDGNWSNSRNNSRSTATAC